MPLSTGPDHGLLTSFAELEGDTFDPAAADPRIADFYEHASRWHLDLWSEWSAVAWPFGRLIAAVEGAGHRSGPVEGCSVHAGQRTVGSMRTVTGRVALRQADLDGGGCAVPDGCAEALRERDAVPVVLEHRVKGITATRQEFAAAPDDGRQLTGVDWPEDVRPGVLVTVTWRPAKEEVVLRTAALVEPMRVDGVTYFHEYDPAVVTREYTPGKANWAKVLHTVRRLGRVLDDGSAVFAEADLPKRSGLGRGDKGAFLLRNAVSQLLREGYVTRVAGSVDPQGQPSYPGVDGEDPAGMLLYAPLVEPAPHPEEPHEPGDGPDRREHWVNGFLRKLPPGAQPSERSLRLHRRVVEQEGLEDTELPPGYTFVQKHHRNG